MTGTLGYTLVLLSVMCATAGSAAGFVAGKFHHAGAWKLTQRFAIGFAASAIAANLVMVYALVTHDFSIKYVAEVGSLSTPLYFTIVSLWASLSGSILFWTGILGVYVLVLLWRMKDRYPEYMPYTFHVLLGISVFFVFLVASVANPFAPQFPVPLDGPGPNTLLQNHWLMAFHPPMLYLGYVGMAIPFSMICSGLLAGRLEAGFMAPLRRWTLIPWMFLSVGIIMGGWWAYGVLGWGGAWAWDPVENASFLPWLTGTAFLHSAMVYQRRQRLRDWTLVLGMTTFLLTILGTFMTRSGVFNSVHSFTQSTIGPIFLGFLSFCALYSLLLLSLRSHVLDKSASEMALTSSAPTKGGWVNRETAIALQNALFVVFTFTVLLGTLYPLIAEALDGRRVSVGEPYFDRWALGLGMGLVFLMGIGPALPWGNLAREAWAKKFLPPTGLGIGVCGLCAIMGLTHWWVSFAVFLCVFALWLNVQEVYQHLHHHRQRTNGEWMPACSRMFRHHKRQIGATLAHIGIISAVLALAFSEGYRLERDYTMSPNETVEFAGYSILFTGARLEESPQRDSLLARFELQKNGETVSVQEPHLNYYPTQREPVWTPAVYTTLAGDIYLSLIQVSESGDQVVLRAISMPGMVWLWIAAPLIALGAIFAAWPVARRKESDADEVAEATP